MALGHEGVGIVEELGPNVKELKKGDRVGWGYEHNSCGRCDQCLTGRETYCNQREMYGSHNLDQGSFASHAVWREAFVYKVPDELSDAEAKARQLAELNTRYIEEKDNALVSWVLVVLVTWPSNTPPRWAATSSSSPVQTTRRTRL